MGDADAIEPRFRAPRVGGELARSIRSTRRLPPPWWPAIEASRQQQTRRRRARSPGSTPTQVKQSLAVPAGSCAGKSGPTRGTRIRGAGSLHGMPWEVTSGTSRFLRPALTIADTAPFEERRRGRRGATAAGAAPGAHIIHDTHRLHARRPHFSRSPRSSRPPIFSSSAWAVTERERAPIGSVNAAFSTSATSGQPGPYSPNTSTGDFDTLAWDFGNTDTSTTPTRRPSYTAIRDVRGPLTLTTASGTSTATPRSSSRPARPQTHLLT